MQERAVEVPRILELPPTTKETYILPALTVSEQQVFEELPEGLLEILDRFNTHQDFATWMESECQKADKISSQRAEQLIVLAYLFGLESKPDRGVEHSLATKVKNSQVSLLTSRKIDNLFYRGENYEQSLSIEDIHEGLKRSFAVIGNDSGEPQIRQFSRIKQKKSLIEKVRSILKNKKIKDVDLYSDDKLLDAVLQMGHELSETPAWYDSLRVFDDLIGFNFVINDIHLTGNQRVGTLTRVLEQVKFITENLADTQKIVIERKQSRAPSFEAVNIYIYGPLNHNRFGDLPVKLQIRFERGLWQESAMYYLYKTCGEWQMPPWASTIDFAEATSFRDIQEKLFQNFKNWYADMLKSSSEE